MLSQSEISSPSVFRKRTVSSKRCATPTPATDPAANRSRRHVSLEGIADAPDETVVTISEVSALSGFATVTLRLWARSEQPRGPRQFKVEGRPRYRLGEVRAWLSGADKGR